MRRKDLTMELHDGNRERTVRRALGVTSTGARLHQACWPVDHNEHVCVEKCPLITRHMADATVAAAEEQEHRSLLKSRDDSASVGCAPRG